MFWPKLKTVKNILGFLGLLDYFLRFFEDFTTLAATLYERTRGQKEKTSIELSLDKLEAVARMRKFFLKTLPLTHTRKKSLLPTVVSKVATFFLL